jgi:hypothetical protein
LALCAEKPVRSRIEDFLLGLSSDELQFIAEYLGCCILESGGQCRCSRAELAQRIAQFQKARQDSAHSTADQEHKMILLLEFLCLSGRRHEAFTFPLSA